MTEVIAPGTFNKGIARVNDVGHSYFYESPSLLSLFGFVLEYAGKTRQIQATDSRTTRQTVALHLLLRLCG
jgi:hypothetical protein